MVRNYLLEQNRGLGQMLIKLRLQSANGLLRQAAIKFAHTARAPLMWLSSIRIGATRGLCLTPL